MGDDELTKLAINIRTIIISVFRFILFRSVRPCAVAKLLNLAFSI